MSPLVEAVIAGDLETAKKLKDSEWRFTPDPLGFTPYELAQFLGKTEIEAIFSPLPDPSFLSREEFEKTFGVIYRPYLTFPSYEFMKEAIANCPYILRFASENRVGGAKYQRRMATGYTAPIIVKWIDDVMGRGAFAAVDIAENAYVGEYTGVVRRLYRSHPDHNGYCFHYPTKMWSWNYFTVDSLKEGNLIRFVNHSDTPNLKPLCLVDRRILHLCFFAARKIQKGEELTCDYGKDYWIQRVKLSSL